MVFTAAMATGGQTKAVEAVPDAVTALTSAYGQGIFGGMLAAALSHLTFGTASFVVMALTYSLSMSSLRGWGELSAIMALMGTVVLYFAIYESFALESVGLAGSIGLSILAVALFITYTIVVITGIARDRTRALSRLTFEDGERWEETYFAALRANRVAGRRNTFLLIRPLFWMAAMGALAWGFDGRVLDALVHSVILFQGVVFGRLFTYARRLNQLPADAAIAAAARPPILFLRPFSLDGLPVDAIGDGMGTFNVFGWLDKRTFEERLNSAFEDLGPVIAIGRPGESVAPLGAAREYVDDASWQELVLRRAEESQLVIMQVDATPGMEWEIANVTERVGLQRVLIVLPPGKDLFEPRPQEWYERWSALQRRFAFLPEVSQNTVGILFDIHDQPIMLTSDEKSVEKRLAVIRKAWMNQAAPQG